MKKIIILLITLLLVLTACGNKDTGKDTPKDDTNNQQEQNIKDDDKKDKQEDTSIFASLVSREEQKFSDGDAYTLYYSYDNDGNITNIRYFSDGEMFLVQDYLYNDENKLYQINSIYDPDDEDRFEDIVYVSYEDDKTIETTIYEDDEFSAIDETTLINVGDYSFVLKDVYKYIPVDGEAVESGYVYEYEYKDGLIVSGIIKYDEEDDGKVTYDYNDDSQMISYVFESLEDDSCYANEYIYENGLLVKEVQYIDNDLFASIDYFYEYSDVHHAFALK